jgi:hypothetical protein
VAIVCTTEVGPPMGLAFAVDELRGRAWIGDWGALREVELATGRVRSIALAPYAAVRSVAIDPRGAPWLLAEPRDDDPPSGGFRAPPRGRPRIALVHLEGDRVRAIVERAFAIDRTAPCLTITEDGTVLGPTEEGAALLAPDGRVLRTVAAQRTKHCSPAAAIDASGRHLATTSGEGAIMLEDVATGERRAARGPFRGVMALRVLRDGTVFVEAGVPDYDLHRIAPDGSRTQLGQRGTGYGISADGRRAYVASHGRCLELDVDARRELRALPIQSMARHARVVVGERAVWVRTDLGALERLDLA